MAKEPQETQIVIPTRTLLKVIAFGLGTWLLVDTGRLVASALLLLVLAMFLAVALDPAVRFLQRRGLSRVLAVAAISVSGFLVLAGIGAIFVPPLVSQTEKLANEAPHLRQDLNKHSWIHNLDEKYHIFDKGEDKLTDLPNLAQKDAKDLFKIIVSSVASVVTLIFLTIFLLLEGGHVAQGVVRIWPQIAERRWWKLVQEAYRTIGGYVSGTALVSLLDGLAILVALAIFGTPFLLPLALWAALWGIVPIIGGAIGTAPAILVAFTLGWVPGVVVLVIALVYHIVIRAILHPAIVGRAIEMSPFFVFISILFGDKLLGIIGIILAIPFAGILQIVLTDLLAVREENKEPVVMPDLHDNEEETKE